MKKPKNIKNCAEIILLISLIIASVVAMQTYAQRTLNTGEKEWLMKYDKEINIDENSNKIEFKLREDYMKELRPFEGVDDIRPGRGYHQIDNDL